MLLRLHNHCPCRHKINILPSPHPPSPAPHSSRFKQLARRMPVFELRLQSAVFMAALASEFAAVAGHSYRHRPCVTAVRSVTDSRPGPDPDRTRTGAGREPFTADPQRVYDGLPTTAGEGQPRSKLVRLRRGGRVSDSAPPPPSPHLATVVAVERSLTWLWRFVVILRASVMSRQVIRLGQRRVLWCKSTANI